MTLYLSLFYKDFTLASLQHLLSIEIKIGAVDGAAVAFLRCLLARADLPAMTRLIIEFECDTTAHEDDLGVDSDSGEETFTFKPFNRDAHETTLEREQDGPVLRRDIWRNMLDVSISFKSTRIVVLEDATSFLGLFGGLKENHALRISDVRFED
jgi:hypothetical protein